MYGSEAGRGRLGSGSGCRGCGVCMGVGRGGQG